MVAVMFQQSGPSTNILFAGKSSAGDFGPDDDGQKPSLGPGISKRHSRISVISE